MPALLRMPTTHGRRAPELLPLSCGDTADALACELQKEAADRSCDRLCRNESTHHQESVQMRPSFEKSSMQKLKDKLPGTKSNVVLALDATKCKAPEERESSGSWSRVSRLLNVTPGGRQANVVFIVRAHNYMRWEKCCLTKFSTSNSSSQHQHYPNGNFTRFFGSTHPLNSLRAWIPSL
jgi:hypothetical protein